MTDIVKRARIAGHDETQSTGQLYLDLADEIERLRGAIEEMTPTYERWQREMQEAVEEERERCKNIVSGAENDAYAQDEWEAHELLRNVRIDIENG